MSTSFNDTRRRPSKDTASVLDMVTSTARYGAFLGGLGGVYVAVDEIIAALLGDEK